MTGQRKLMLYSYITVSAKTLHVSMQILAYFSSLKSQNYVTAQQNVINIGILIATTFSYMLV